MFTELEQFAIAVGTSVTYGYSMRSERSDRRTQNVKNTILIYAKSLVKTRLFFTYFNPLLLNPLYS